MIETTTDSVLDRNYVVNPRRLLSTYDFRLGTLPQTITIRLFWGISSRRVESQQSHFLQTPAQHGPYTAEPSHGENEDEALRNAVAPLIAFYEYAILEGFKPEDTWLVPNKSF